MAFFSLSYRILFTMIWKFNSDSCGLDSFLDSSVGKESACNAGDPSSIPGLGRSPGEGKGYLSSILAWRIPWTVYSVGSQSVTKSWTEWLSLSLADLLQLLVILWVDKLFHSHVYWKSPFLAFPVPLTATQKASTTDTNDLALKDVQVPEAVLNTARLSQQWPLSQKLRDEFSTILSCVVWDCHLTHLRCSI